MLMFKDFILENMPDGVRNPSAPDEQQYRFSTHDIHPDDRLPVTTGHVFRVLHVKGKTGTFRTSAEPYGNIIYATKVSDKLDAHSRTRRKF